MADRNKFEEMLELLVNEDKEGAEALFHEIVVEKSRDIYESLLEDEAEVDESEDDVEEATDEEVDESDEDLDEATDEEVDESDEEVEEDFDLDEFEVEADPMDAMGGDAGDDMEMDIDMGDDEDDEGEEDEGEEGPEAAMDNLEDALDALKAEFEKMMDGDEGDDEESEDEPEEEAFAFESNDEEVDEAADEEVDEAADEEVDEAEEETDESEKSDVETMREYVEKVSGGGLDAQGSAPMGDNGANTKSPVAGKNDMGGTASNLNQGKDNESGDHGGFAGLNAKEDDAGNRNKPGGMSAKKGMKNEPGHGAEKKGKAPEKAGADSPLNGESRRAK